MPAETDSIIPLLQAEHFRLTQENKDLREQIARERGAGASQYQELRRRYDEAWQMLIDKDKQLMVCRQALDACDRSLGMVIDGSSLARLRGQVTAALENGDIRE